MPGVWERLLAGRDIGLHLTTQEADIYYVKLACHSFVNHVFVISR